MSRIKQLNKIANQLEKRLKRDAQKIHIPKLAYDYFACANCDALQNRGEGELCLACLSKKDKGEL